MSPPFIGIAAVTYIAIASFASAGGHKAVDTKAGLAPKNAQHAATQVAPPLAERVDALLRGGDLKPGRSMGLASADGTVQLTVTVLTDGKVVRLTNRTTHATIGEWRLSRYDQRQIEAATQLVFAGMGLEPPAHVDNKAASGDKTQNAQ